MFIFFHFSWQLQHSIAIAQCKDSYEDMRLHFREVFQEINTFLDAQADDADGKVRLTVNLSPTRIPRLYAVSGITGSTDASYTMLFCMKLG
jgi:hypothetical protein